MALAPRFAGHKLSAARSQNTLHTLELYLDYVCPYSKKMFMTIYRDVFPLVQMRYPEKVQFIFRQQIQPWHPSSTLVHEAALAVLTISPDKFYPFSEALFDQQEDYFDVNVVKESRNETYDRLATLASTVGVTKEKVLERIRVDEKADEDGSLNVGNQVTNDLKLLVKANRLTGVHVTPTVVFNGIVENSISSSFTKEQWAEWLQRNAS